MAQIILRESVVFDARKVPRDFGEAIEKSRRFGLFG